MSDLRVLSLFSGIGGIDLGFERAGVPTRLLCEKDEAARSVLSRHFPSVPVHPDVEGLSPHDLLATRSDPSRSVLAAGFPCQDLSLAGARRGMDHGTRSGLFWNIPRLLSDFPARWVVLENVPGLLSSRSGRDMGAVLGALADLGYGFAYRVLDAQNFGVPQRRRRVVVVGHRGAEHTAAAQVLLEPEGSRRHPAPGGPSRTLDPRTPALGAGVAGRAVDGHASTVCITGSTTHTLTAEGHDASEDGTGRGSPIIAATLTAGSHSPGVSAPSRRSEDDVNLVPFHGSDGIGVRRLTPLELERLQGFPDGWTAGQSDARRRRQIGNAVAVPVFEWVARRVVAHDAGRRPARVLDQP